MPPKEDQEAQCWQNRVPHEVIPSLIALLINETVPKRDEVDDIASLITRQNTDFLDSRICCL